MTLLPTVALAAGLVADPARAQGHLTLQAGGASALPGVDAPGDAAFYGLGGLTLDWSGNRSLFVASLQGGLAGDEATGSDFVSGAGSFEVWHGPGTALGLTGRGSAFRVQAPFTYRTEVARIGPAVRVRAGRVTTTLRAEVGAGRTTVELRRDDGRVRRAERDLWSRGAELEVAVGGGGWRAGVTGGGWETSGGGFGKAEAWGAVAWRRVGLRLDVGGWDTPLGAEWTGGLSMVVALGGRASVAATAGRAAPDPLSLVEAGGQGGVLVGWDLAAFGGPPPPLAAVEWGAQGPVARFRLDDAAARGAALVEVLGDFTGWEPVPMRREGGAWVGDAPVAPGVHHFGFRVDGAWYVPEGRSGNVPDEWGRTNATLVVAEPDRGGRP